MTDLSPEKDPPRGRPDRSLLVWQAAAAAAIAASAFAHYGVPAGFAAISFVAAGMGFTYAGTRSRMFVAAGVMAAAGAVLSRIILGAP